MNIRQLLTTAFFICLANGVAQQAMAASQGSLGGSSSGTTTVSLVKGFGLKISDIDDVDFGPTTTQPADAYEDVCVYSSNGTYRMLRRDLIEEYQPDLFEVGQGTAYRITAGDHCPFNNAVRLG